jgi:hypothetical protein
MIGGRLLTQHSQYGTRRGQSNNNDQEDDSVAASLLQQIFW